jgi:hypothetical protein
MVGVDGLLLTLIAIADFCVLLHLRQVYQKRKKRERAKRMMRSLRVAVERDALTPCEL